MTPLPTMNNLPIIYRCFVGIYRSIKEIVAVLTDMDADLAALEQRQANTRALKQGIELKLLTGRTRLE